MVNTVSIEHNEQGDLVFTIAKQWERIPQDNLRILNDFAIIGSYKSTSGIYYILEHRPKCPLDFTTVGKRQLVKIVPDEESGKLLLYRLEITKDEAAMLIKHFITDDATLWDDLP